VERECRSLEVEEPCLSAGDGAEPEARGDARVILGESILMDFAGERAENRDGGVSPVLTDEEAREELMELTEAVEDLRIAFKEIEESRAGFLTDEVEADDEMVLPAYRGCLVDCGDALTLYRLLPIVVTALFAGDSSSPNSSNAVDTSEGAELPMILTRFEGAMDVFKRG